jgi:hypothetical protein
MHCALSARNTSFAHGGRGGPFCLLPTAPMRSVPKTSCVSTLRNERPRLPYFLRYYRDRGVSHFFFVDNDSDDGTREYLAVQEDCSVWTTPDSYKRARFGIDWMNRLLRRYGTGIGA